MGNRNSGGSILKNDPVKLVGFLLLVALLVILCAPVWASGGDNDTGPDVDVDSASSVSNSVRDSSSALGLSSGDVDINQCYRSYNYLVVWQDTKPNPLCLAQQLMAEGNYAAAAILRCEPRTIHKSYGGKDACIAALAVSPPEPVVVEPVIDTDDDDDDYREQQWLAYEQLQAEVEELKKAPPERVIVQQVPSDDGAERRANARAALSEFKK